MNELEELVQLFRPVGLAELALIFDSRMKEFPPRLPEQPIFYPVLNQAYASEIARKWNTKSAPGFAGYVTRFNVSRSYVTRFSVQTVGGGTHQELWVPAEQLPEFNSQIVGAIQTIEAYFGLEFVGFVPDNFGLRGKNATEQLVCLAKTFDYSGMDFICETGANAKAVYLNYPFWTAREFVSLGVSEEEKRRLFATIVTLWNERFPEISLCDGQS